MPTPRALKKSTVSESVQLLETVYSPSAKIDKEAGIVREVKVLGRESVNNRVYSDAAMNQAAKFYEGAEVNIDHDRKEPHRERGLMEGFGVLRNVSQRADGVYADLHYLKGHPATSVFLERAERFPEKIGLSHTADGSGKTTGGKLVVESISRIISVDLVRNPATNKSLFESREHSVKKTFKEILEAAFPKTVKGCLLLEDDSMAAMPIETPDAGSSDDQIKAAFSQAIDAAFRDDSLDAKATIAKIKDIVNAYYKLADGGSKSDTSDAGGSGNGGVTESKDIAALKGQLKLMESREHCRDLLESEGVKSTPIRLKQLAALATDDERKQAIVDWKGSESSQRPRTASPLYESRDTTSQGKIPTEAKDFAAMCR